jgi:hypothetical protein
MIELHSPRTRLGRVPVAAAGKTVFGAALQTTSSIPLSSSLDASSAPNLFARAGQVIATGALYSQSYNGTRH